MTSKLNLRRRAALLLLALFCSLTATWTQAQSELTVYDDGTKTGTRVPAYINFFDEFTRSQFVIPADDLDGMEDCTISAIKFYTTSGNVPYTTVSTVDVYLKEVSYTSISGFEAKANCSTVYQGTLEIVSADGGGELTITFTTPFTYHGGNLLVGIENTTDAAPKTIVFYGEAVSGASVAGYNGSSLDYVSANQQDFIPKTTFYYSPAPAQELTVYEGANPYAGQQGAQPNQFIPACIHYFDEYTRSQFVIPAAELTSLNGSTISTIKFYTTSESAPYPGEGKTAAPVDVYLKEVSYSKMTTFDYEPRDGATTVYHGKLSVVPGDGCGIMTINLSTPYEYGGGNLLIGIDNTETASYQVVNFMGTEVTHFAAISGHAQDKGVLNSNPGQSMYFIPQTTLVTGGIVPPAKPTNVEITNLLANSASIYWDLPADATGSVYQYKKASDTEWGAAVSTESQSITIDGLQPATVYKFRVKTLRGSSASSWATVTFTTDCAAVTAFQWYENFEGYSTGDFDVLCWRNEHIAGPNTQLYRISGDNVGGNTGKKLYLPTMGGTDNKVMLVLPQMILGTNYMFSLDIYRSDTHPEKTGEGIRVYASADGNLEGATEMAFIPRVCTVDSSVIPAEQESGWYTYDLLIPMSGSCYIILVGESQNGNTISLDNFRVDVAPDCMRPTGLRVTLTNGDGSFAGLFWQENGDADTWQVCLNGDESHLVTVHNTNNNYSSLTPETIYTAKVRAYCSATSQSAWSNEISFEPTDKQIIGSGSATNGSIPTQSNYNYSLTQQIYTADEVGVAGTIESIDFKSTSSTAVTRNLDIYMVSTEKSNFSGNSDWVAVSPSDRVYSGEVTFAAGAWTTITLDSPFEYNGNSNIAIIVDDNSGTWSGTSTTFFSAFSTSNQTPNQTLYKFSENTNFDPTNTSYSGSVMSSKNQIRLAKGSLPALLKPTELAVSDITFESATLSWKENGTATQWQIGFVNNEGTITSVVTAYANPYTLTNLTPETTYRVKVRASNGGEKSAWSNEISFTTLEKFKRPTNIAANNITFNSADISWTGEADSYNLRYRTLGNVIFSDDFESGMGNWTIIRNGEGNENTDWRQLELGSSSAHSGSHVAQSESWNNSAYQVDNWLISPRIPLNGILTYWVRDDGTNHDHYDIYVSTEPDIDLDTFTKFYEPDEATDNWTEVTVDLSAYAGQEGYIAFRHQDYDEYLLWIDDVTVAVVDVIGDWNKQNNVTSPHTIDNLDEKTIYQVEIQGVYEGSESGSSAWEGTEFTTLDSNPVPSDFITSMWNTGAVINWTGTGTSYNFRYRTAAKKETLFFDDFENGLGQWDTSYLKGGSNVFYYNSDPNNRFFGFNSDALVSQPLTVTSAATLSFSYSNYYLSYPESFMVGYSTTGNDLEKDFIWSAETTAANNSWNLYEQALPAGVKYVAIKYTDGYYYLFIDDVEIYVNSAPASEWISQTRTYASGIMSSLATNNVYEYQAQSVRGSKVSNWSDIQSFALLTLQDDADNRCLIRGNTGRLAHVTLAGRTLKKDGNYNMVCLPFDLTIADSPFADATIERLTNYNYNSTTQTLTLTFEDYTPTVIPAGYPFIVKWADGEDWTDPQFANVIMGSNLDQTVKAEDNIQFVGNFMPMTLNGYKRLYVGSDKPLSWPATNVDIGAFRAYLKVLRDDVTQVVIDFGDGTQMSVSSILGDANGDAKVTTADAVGVVNYILGKPSDNFYKATANVNGDTDGDGNPNISVSDAVGIVDIVKNNSTSAPKMAAPAADKKPEKILLETKTILPPEGSPTVKKERGTERELRILPHEGRSVAREDN